MEAWLQSLAVGVAVLVGLVSPSADLRLEVSALRGERTVDVQAEVGGAVTPEVKDFLLAGNSLVLVFDFQWGNTRLVRAKTIAYRAWDGVFEVRGDGVAPVTTSDALSAFRAWRTLDRTALGAFADLEPALGSPLRVRASLKPAPGTASEGAVPALWGYKVPEDSLVYRSWLEFPR